ncbi:hypothetical protein SAMN05421636_10136 [Pricia antarctica]|uniref:Deoxyribose-phosphate aldolase n=1 Tax=Pricia antarctica TaxID=641691 RepID=A0A1G6VR35_9FLAO|nr:DUF6503 family protein [Pricia antarctica]SDD56048.1 hypothetical protein SAMN05421636_10136 [Pricia antarctica]
MKRSISILYLTVLVGLSSCNTEKKKDTISSHKKEETLKNGDAQSETKLMDKADSLVLKTIAAHGGELYDTANYKFRFRDKNYSFHNKPGGYTYTVTGQKEGKEIRDVLENGTLTRTVDGTENELSPKDVVKYTEALNSVIYFATLPYKLNDAAVKKSYEGQTTIKNQDYEALSVTFAKEGGGNDHDDKFMYWINRDTNTIDYLAYSYETNEGGVRFRSAYNPRTIGGIRFQDYINYEAPIGTPLSELPELYEAGKLKKFSKIETEDVTVIED